MAKGDLRKDQGFSLMEVLIGLVILAIGLLAIAGMHFSSVRGNLFSDNMMQASYFAQDLLERLKALPFDDPRLTPTEGEIPDYDHPEGRSVRGVTFVPRYAIRNHPTLDLRVITVTVRWRDTSEHSVSYSTQRSR